MRYEWIVETFEDGQWRYASGHFTEESARDAASGLSAAVQTRVRKVR